MEEYIECTFCEKKNNRYIRLLDTYICENCEKEITRTTCDDKKYEYYNILMKRVWSDYLINL